MIVENNGYIVAYKQELSFLYEPDYNDFDDDIRVAHVFGSKEEAKNWIDKNIIESSRKNFTVMKLMTTYCLENVEEEKEDNGFSMTQIDINMPEYSYKTSVNANEQERGNIQCQN